MTPLIRFFARYRDLINIMKRVVCYCLGLLVTMWLATTYFADTYTANLCLFTTYSVLFESLTSLPKKGVARVGPLCVRRILYIVCVLLLAVCSVILFLQAIHNCRGKP